MRQICFKNMHCVYGIVILSFRKSIYFFQKYKHYVFYIGRITKNACVLYSQKNYNEAEYIQHPWCVHMDMISDAVMPVL